MPTVPRSVSTPFTPMEESPVLSTIWILSPTCEMLDPEVTRVSVAIPPPSVKSCSPPVMAPLDTVKAPATKYGPFAS
jgi:hypothetical protein